jgi:hypothetical protein
MQTNGEEDDRRIQCSKTCIVMKSWDLDENDPFSDYKTTKEKIRSNY